MKATPIQLATMARYRARRRAKCSSAGLCYYCQLEPVLAPAKRCEACLLAAKMRRLGIDEGTL